MALSRQDLWSLEEYSEKRSAFRTKVIEHKKDRQISLTANARLMFEDEMTIRYQIQEMLRIEKVFDAAGIKDELDAYNPLIPDGNNWKATFMLEYDDVEERRVKLAGLVGVEDLVWMQVEGFDKVFAIADEDLERENDVKTSSVHFVRFQLSDDMVAAAKSGKGIFIGCDHENLNVAGQSVVDNVAQSLVADLAA
ncbi:MAG: DUF3501 family protein [Xanthomonadales bacterium]|jgi:hypothetical protein|nr:DUF3501 family protein [Xanthomonadales bacterium]